MDKVLIRERFAKAADSYLKSAHVQRHTAEHLLKRLLEHTGQESLTKVYEVGCGTGLFTRLFLRSFPSCHLYLNDICPEVKDTLVDCLAGSVEFIPGDAEQIALPGELDMIVSCSVLQWFDYPELFIRKCLTALQPGGLLAFATYGERNLNEITTLTGQSLQYHSLNKWTTMVQQYFTIIHSEEEELSLHFDSPIDVLKHFKETGVSGISRQQWSPGRLADFCNQYKKNYEEADGKVHLTYHPLFIICKKREEI